MLTNDVEHAKITIADYPGQQDVLVVTWQGVPGVTPASGAMIYHADGSTSEGRYFAIGGGGRFALVERGGGRRSHGSSRRAFEVTSDDPKRPLPVVGDASQAVDVPALLPQYDAFENIAAPGEASTVIEAAVAAKAAQTNKACGSKIAAKLQWKTFATPASARLAKQAVSILEALEAACADKDSEANNLRHLGEGLNKLCGDKDYKAALAKISKIVYRSTSNDKIWVKAVVSRSTPLLDNNSFGSTRGASDYESAAEGRALTAMTKLRQSLPGSKPFE